VEYTKGLLEEIGLEPERLEMFSIGASDAPAWVRAVSEMVQRARNLGPNPLRKRPIETFRGHGRLTVDNIVQD
jgi:F420-non-reducing hydrogenase iron-sulfur subunit